MSQPWIYFFGDHQADGSDALRELIGGKGASLAEMTRAGLKVPPGFTITTAACAHFLEDACWPEGLEAAVEENLRRLEALTGRSFGAGGAPLLLAVRSGAAQSMPGMMDTVLNVGLNPACVAAMAERTGNPRGAWEAYLHFLLIYLRTVGNVDGATLSRTVEDFCRGRGQRREEDLDAPALQALTAELREAYATWTGEAFPDAPRPMLRAAIEAVFRSWNSERAIAYRRYHRIEGLRGTAVNLQAMCPSEVSGVLFTADPVDASREQMILEASFGLGEAVVLGRVTPDRFVLDRRTLAITERAIASKQFRVATLAEDGRGQDGGQDEASLSDAQVVELARLGLKVEAYFQTPCDLEWGLSRGQFYLLQSRPIRRAAPSGGDAAEREQVRREEVAALRAQASPRGTVWSRFNLSEILPEPRPMTWSIVRRFMSGRGGYGLMYRDLGFDPDPALDELGVFDLVAGRTYCNLDREPRLQYARLPFEHSFAALKKDPAKAIYPAATFNPARADWTFYLTIPLHFFRMMRSQLQMQRLTRTFAEDFEQKLVPAFLAQVDAAAGEDLRVLTPAQLLARLHEWMQRTLVDFARESLKPTALAALLLGNFERAFANRFAPTDKRPREAQAIGLQKAQAAVRELVMGVKPREDSDLAAGIASLRAGRLTKAEFLRRFGHRGSHEMELARPRWSEAPESLDAMLAQAGAEAHPAAPAEDPWPRVADELRLQPAQRLAVERELRLLHRYLGLREAAKHVMLRGYALLRQTLLELDRRFGLQGRIFDLGLEDLPQLIQAPAGSAPAELVQKAEQNRRRRELLLSLPAPQVLFSDDLDALGREVPLPADAVLQGTPLSAGVGEAEAWVLEDASNAVPPDAPYILVCPSTDPAWLPLFMQARGLVMETGGVLSHGAIVAREFGLPAIAGISQVHRRIQTGQRLRVDGTTGQLCILDRIPAGVG